MEARNQKLSTNSLYVSYFYNPTDAHLQTSSLIMCGGGLGHRPSRLPTLESVRDSGLQLLCSAICGHTHSKAVLPVGFSQPVTECGRNSKVDWALGDTGLL